jgi:hypothetical protein
VSGFANALLTPVGQSLGTAIATGLVAPAAPPAPVGEAERLSARYALLDMVPVWVTFAVGGLVGALLVGHFVRPRKTSPQRAPSN